MTAVNTDGLIIIQTCAVSAAQTMKRVRLSFPDLLLRTQGHAERALEVFRYIS